VMIAGSALVVARLVWEMTYLTWREGEQMVGFQIAHVFPFVYIFWLGAGVWALLAAGAFVIRMRRISLPDTILLAVLVASFLPLAIPYKTWRRSIPHLFGPPPATPMRMFSAVWQDDLSVVVDIGRRGVSLNTQDDMGCSLLYRAAEAGRLDVIRYLLSNGQDINLRTCNGDTALHGAAHYDSTGSIVNYLLEVGADTTVRNLQRLSPAEEADRYGHHNVALILSGPKKK
jgi:ankyrin repeat protein